MVNPGTSSYDLRKWPTDQKDTFYNTVKNGKGDMPAWGDVLFPEELDAIWVYVATRAGKSRCQSKMVMIKRLFLFLLITSFTASFALSDEAEPLPTLKRVLSRSVCRGTRVFWQENAQRAEF